MNGPLLNRPCAYLLLAGATLAGCKGPPSATVPFHVKANLTLKEYRQLVASNVSGRDSLYVFPRLEIDSPEGELIFQGERLADSLSALRSLSSRLQVNQARVSLKPQDEPAGQLQRYLYTCHIENPAVAKEHPTVVSIALQQCDSCGVQEQSVDRLANASTKLAEVNTLQIEVYPSLQ